MNQSLALPQTECFFQSVNGVNLECVWHRPPGAEAVWDPHDPVLVFLHEGLGSVALWRDFPAQVGSDTGLDVLVYSRMGYGQSDQPEAPFQPDYMHREAQQMLPALINAMGIRRYVLIGHSDGASIALITAGNKSEEPAPEAVVVMAPHVFVEDISVASIAEAKRLSETTDMLVRLGKYHADAKASFKLWNGAWLRPEFRDWNIESHLPGITCPVLALQGVDDEYGTMKQIDAIESGVNGEFKRAELQDCGHSPHRDQTEQVRDLITGFVTKPLQGATAKAGYAR